MGLPENSDQGVSDDTGVSDVDSGCSPARRSQSGFPGIPPHTVNDLQNVAWWACMPERTG